MTLRALDSAFAPTNTQIAQAKADGYSAWFGYFKFGDDGIFNGWSDSDFQRVLAGGLQTGAYASGWVNPATAKARGDALGIRVQLDVEGGIRDDGQWVPGWLDVAQAVLYGRGPVHVGRNAVAHIVSYYPGFDPGMTWPTPALWPWAGGYLSKPPVAGWQWMNSHSYYGITVDTTYLDDDFFASGGKANVLDGGLDMTTADTILAAVTIMPPRKKNGGQDFAANETDAYLLNIANTSSWANIATQYGSDGETYIYALAHPESRQTVGAVVSHLAATTGVDLSPVTSMLKGDADAIAAIKAAEDALKAEIDDVQKHVDSDLK